MQIRTPFFNGFDFVFVGFPVPKLYFYEIQLRAANLNDIGEKILGGEGLRDDAQACLDTDSDTAVTNLYFLLMQQFGFSRRYYSREQLYIFILFLFNIPSFRRLIAVQVVWFYLNLQDCLQVGEEGGG